MLTTDNSPSTLGKEEIFIAIYKYEGIYCNVPLGAWPHCACKRSRGSNEQDIGY